MRILQVNAQDKGLGAFSTAWKLFLEYKKRGHASWLAVGRKTSASPDVFVIPNIENRPRWTRFWRSAQPRLRGPFRILGRMAWLGEGPRLLRSCLGREDFEYPGTWRLLDLTPRRPDLVHCNILHGGYFDLRALPWLSRQVPVILNLQDEWLFTGHCAYSMECGRWRTGCGKCPDLKRYPAVRRDGTGTNWRRKQGIYAASRLFMSAPSKWLIQRAQESMVRGLDYRVIPNAVNLGTFRPGDRGASRQSLGLPSGAVIVMLMAHSSYKDYPAMEATLGLLSRSGLPGDLLFVCLGKEGGERQLGEGRIRFVGVEHDQSRVANYFRSANVYLHLAKAENLAQAIIESLACGVPVVAASVGGIPEEVPDGAAGFLVDPGDVHAAAERIQQLLTDADLCQRMSRAAAEYALQFDLKKQADQFLAYYRDVMEIWKNATREPDANP
jgi:glycosyltransferase involved in cell wall biosynthesis